MAPVKPNYQTGLHRSFTGRKVLISKELWQWSKYPIIQIMGKDFNHDVDFMFIGIKPVAAKTEAQAQEILEVLKSDLNYLESKHKILEKIDGVYLRVLLEVIDTMLMDIAPVNPKIKESDQYKSVTGIVDKVLEELDSRLEKAYMNEIGMISEFLLEDIWKKENEYHGKEYHWFRGVPYTEYESWLKAVRNRNSKEEQK